MQISYESTEFTKEVEQGQLDPNLITLSGLAAPRWANLPNLERIRERNKPIEPLKTIKNAPFFLPTIETLEGFVFEKENVMNVDEIKENPKNIAMAQKKLLELETPWACSLLK